MGLVGEGGLVATVVFAGWRVVERRGRWLVAIVGVAEGEVMEGGKGKGGGRGWPNSWGHGTDGFGMGGVG
jgi:hypothetical protein